jgi:hypothetical protein
MPVKKIKTFEAACKVLKLDPAKVIPDFSEFPKEDQAAMIAHAKLIIVAKALNGDWKPNWQDYNQYKYYPWFEMDAPGFRLYTLVDFCQHSDVGSRLCFRDRETANYAGKTFIDLYQDYMVIS